MAEIRQLPVPYTGNETDYHDYLWISCPWLAARMAHLRFPERA